MMHCRESPNSMPENYYRLLGLVSTPRPTEARGRLLRELARDVCWEQVPPIAAEQRIGPLLYWHLREYGIPYPNHIRRTLAAIFARQKAIAMAQTETLAEIIAALRAARIESVVLKGGALAHILFPEPGLRPMEDLDILVSPDQGEAARVILCNLGFRAPAPTTRYERLQHHLPLAQRMTDDILVSVEIHTAAFTLLMAHDLSFTTSSAHSSSMSQAVKSCRHWRQRKCSGCNTMAFANWPNRFVSCNWPTLLASWSVMRTRSTGRD